MVLSVGAAGTARELNIGMEDYLSVAGEHGTHFVQNCEDVLCLGDVDKMAGDECIAVAKDTVRVTREKTKKTRVRKKAGYGGLAELDFGFATNFCNGWRDVVALSEKRNGLEARWRVDKKGQIVGDAGFSKRVGEAARDSGKGAAVMENVLGEIEYFSK